MNFKTSGTLRQVSLFIGVGVLATSLDAFLYFALSQWGIRSYFAKGSSYILGMCASYIGNRIVVFNFKTDRILKFILVYSFGLAVNVISNQYFLGVGTIKEAHQVAWVLATIASAITNFLLLKLWVFA
jgi:putative flippase GtrA